jgi:hypothetical protein
MKHKAVAVLHTLGVVWAMLILVLNVLVSVRCFVVADSLAQGWRTWTNIYGPYTVSTYIANAFLILPAVAALLLSSRLKAQAQVEPEPLGNPIWEGIDHVDPRKPLLRVRRRLLAYSPEAYGWDGPWLKEYKDYEGAVDIVDSLLKVDR